MPTLETLDLSNAAEALGRAAERALGTQSADEIELLEQQLNQFEAGVREVQQGLWAGEAEAALRQLEAGQPLSEDNREAIRAFLISDAQSYLEAENNFAEWITELRRLMKEIARTARLADRSGVAALRGVLKDAIRLVPDIRNYLDERRRVELCNQGLENLDQQSRTTLARLLRDQLTSLRM